MEGVLSPAAGEVMHTFGPWSAPNRTWAKKSHCLLKRRSWLHLLTQGLFDTYRIAVILIPCTLNAYPLNEPIGVCMSPRLSTQSVLTDFGEVILFGGFR